MRLVIGGYAQGKLDYVIQKYKIEKEWIFDGKLPESTDTTNGRMVVNHLHRIMKEGIVNGENPEEKINRLTEDYPDCIMISDEIGSGIVPMEALEREYRERTGRILTELAKKAETVERVICGIGQKIK